MNKFDDFRVRILKASTPKVFKVRNSNGNKKAWRWLKKNKWLNLGQPITEREFGIIVKTINKCLVDKLLEGHDINLPCGMGRIELRKYNPKLEYKDGKVETTIPVNWLDTLKLWYEDKEAMDNKLLIKREYKPLFKIRYNKEKCKYKNQIFYQFKANREVRKKLSEKINNNQIDAFLI